MVCPSLDVLVVSWFLAFLFCTRQTCALFVIISAG